MLTRLFLKFRLFLDRNRAQEERALRRLAYEAACIPVESAAECGDGHYFNLRARKGAGCPCGSEEYVPTRQAVAVAR